MTNNQIALIQQGISIAAGAFAGVPAALQARATVETLVREKRDPTPDEWAAINAAASAAHTALQSA